MSSDSASTTTRLFGAWFSLVTSQRRFSLYSVSTFQKTALRSDIRYMIIWYEIRWDQEFFIMHCGSKFLRVCSIRLSDFVYLAMSLLFFECQKTTSLKNHVNKAGPRSWVGNWLQSSVLDSLVFHTYVIHLTL